MARLGGHTGLSGTAGVKDQWLRPWMPLWREGKRREPHKHARTELNCAASMQNPLSQPKGWWCSGRAAKKICRGKAAKAEWAEGLRIGEEPKLGTVKKSVSKKPAKCSRLSEDERAGSRGGY